MAIYVNKKYVTNTSPRPDHDIDVRDKNDKWICDNAKYIYGQYMAGQCGITPSDVEKIMLLRSYMDGNQPVAQYQEKWLAKGKEYGHIDWTNVYSPMPKLIDKVLGMFISQDHNTVATCVSEFAKQYRIKDKAEKYTIIKLSETKKLLNELLGITPDQDPMLNPLFGYIANDVQEIEIMSTSGTVKIPYEIAAEKAIDYTQKLSNYKHLKRTAVKDLLCGYIALREVIDPLNKVIKWENVDITDVIIQYSRNNHFDNSKYFCIQELWTIEDLRKKGFKEDELKNIASKNLDYNMQILGLKSENRAFQFYQTYYPATNSYGYDDFVIPVLYCTFKSNDVKYFKKVKIKNGEDRVYPADFGKIKQDSVTDVMEKIYEGRWIMGTDNLFDGGIMAYIPRDSVGMVQLPCHIAKLTGKSIIERCKHTLDEFAMLGFKLENALAKSQGNQPAFDLSSLDGVATNSGGKITHPFDIIDMYFQGQGVVYRSIPIDEAVNYSRPKPIDIIVGGIGGYLNELLTLRQAYYMELEGLTGITSFETQNRETAVGIAQLAVANMGDILKPLYDIYLEVKEKLSYNTVYRIQLLLNYSANAVKIYTSGIGKHYTEFLKMANTTEPMDIGIKFEALPTDNMKNIVLQWAGRATESGKNGVPILSASEYLYLFNNINTTSGLKEAQMMLRYREQQDDIKANQRQKQAIESQSQAIEQQIAAKGKVEQDKAKILTQKDLTTIQATKDLELRNAKELRGVEAAYNTFNKGMDAGSMQEKSGYENPMQQQPEQQQQPINN